MSKVLTTRVIQRLPELFSAAQWGQYVMLSRMRDEIAADLEASHPAVARRLRGLKGDGPAKAPVAPPTDILDVREPRIALPEVALDVGTRLTVDGLLEEHRRRKDLEAWSLAPRHKVLLFGPPGNGKTTLAEALASELHVPFLVVRYGGLIDSYLGSTGKNLDKAVAFAETGPCVLFIDEFDGIGMARDRVCDVGELRRVTNQLLLALDRLADHVLLVCATNADTLVDHALRRRFDTHIEIAAPSLELRLECAKRELSPELCNGVDMRAQARHVATTVTENIDAVVKACREIRRARALRSTAASSGGTPSLCISDGEG
ncbi:MAG: ATP-binding protein [Rhodanobacteraceae bacterium]|nr:MAG: ATP-binding protein [Rhodanobacteraceae bacterium]